MTSLACPARFERATYALEEFVAAGMFIYFNGLQHKKCRCVINCAMGFVRKNFYVLYSKKPLKVFS
jgi:hypothetical protein